MPEKVEDIFPFHSVDDGNVDKAIVNINSDEVQTYDGIEFSTPDCDDDMALVDKDSIEQLLHEEIEAAQDPALPDPTKHYIKEMVNMALLTREGEQEIAMRVEKSREEIKRIIISFPETFCELQQALENLKESSAKVSDITNEVDEDEEDDQILEIQKKRLIGSSEILDTLLMSYKSCDRKNKKKYLYLLLSNLIN